MSTYIERRDDLNPQEGVREYGDVEFADPTNKKYPIDSPEHVRAAWSYIITARTRASTTRMRSPRSRTGSSERPRSTTSESRRIEPGSNENASGRILTGGVAVSPLVGGECRHASSARMRVRQGDRTPMAFPNRTTRTTPPSTTAMRSR